MKKVNLRPSDSEFNLPARLISYAAYEAVQILSQQDVDFARAQCRSLRASCLVLGRAAGPLDVAVERYVPMRASRLQQSAQVRDDVITTRWQRRT